jgi:predicted nucleic acid-binding protein
MFYLVDTNGLLRFAGRAHVMRPALRLAVRKLRGDGHTLRATPQNFVEFWSVATRPAVRNGLGLTPAQAERRLRLVERVFPRLDDAPIVYPEWRRLVVAYGVSGVKVYDARLVAFMWAYQITHILTFNTADFTRYAPEGVVAVDPRTV